jgi:hypothetical protein
MQRWYEKLKVLAEKYGPIALLQFAEEAPSLA